MAPVKTFDEFLQGRERARELFNHVLATGDETAQTELDALNKGLSRFWRRNWRKYYTLLPENKDRATCQ